MYRFSCVHLFSGLLGVCLESHSNSVFNLSKNYWSVFWPSLVAQTVNCRFLPAMQETWVQSLIWEDSPEEGNGNPIQYSCLENPHGQRSLAGYSPWGHKESDRTERLTFTFTFKVFSRAAVSLCIPISNIWEFRLLYILTNTYFSFLFIIAKLAGVNNYLIMVLVCISLMTNDVEHIFMCIFSTHSSPNHHFRI